VSTQNYHLAQLAIFGFAPFSLAEYRNDNANVLHFYSIVSWCIWNHF